MTRSIVLLCLSVMVVVVCPAPLHAQERIERGPIELILEGAPTTTGDTPAAAVPAAWHERLTPAVRLGIIVVALGVPTGVVVAGRFWRRLPASERALVLLCLAIGRGRGFRHRVRSLAVAQGPGGKPITPVAMMLAPRAFDAALTSANHAERAYGQPLRHAVHGFRKG